jgi:transposase-like protein
LNLQGRELDDDMTKPYSVAFKQKMVQRLIGKNAMSASQLARETGVPQQNLSRWLDQARSLPIVADQPKKPAAREWTVEQKARVLAEASKLAGEELTVYLERAGVRLAEYERWRIALDEGGQASASTTKRIRKLERELARKERHSRRPRRSWSSKKLSGAAPILGWLGLSARNSWRSVSSRRGAAADFLVP